MTEYKLVPVDPTPEMIEAGNECWMMTEGAAQYYWRAMLDAAPSAPGAELSDVTALVDALEEAKAGLEWYQSEYPEAVSGCDAEVMERIDAALAAHRKQGGR